MSFDKTNKTAPRFQLFRDANGDIYLNCDEVRGGRHVHCSIVLDDMAAKMIGPMMDDSSASVDAEFTKSSK